MTENARQSDIQNHAHECMPFPSHLTGYMIGARGRGIQALRDRSGVEKVWITNQNAEHYRRRWSYMHFQGHRANIDAAKCLLMMRVTDAMSSMKNERRPRSRSPMQNEHRHRLRSPPPNRDWE